MTVREQVLEVIANVLGGIKENLTDQQRFSEDLGADSLDRVDLIIEAEEVLEIQIEDKEAANVATVGDLVTLCQKMKKTD